MVLAGDIITLSNYSPLSRFLESWRKPVLYVTGNHEYYTRTPMDEENRHFKEWLADKHPNVSLLLDDEVILDGVHFFGGTMWTNFSNGNLQAINFAQRNMNDFRLIKTPDGMWLKPEDTISLHEAFVKKLKRWLKKKSDAPSVVITHHAPALNPRTKYGDSPLMPAFNSLDMVEIIQAHQPELWIYGHTHECDNQHIGNTRVISNQLGYPQQAGGHECKGFDPEGLPIDVS
jgi:predicted phosphohydrolase